MTFFPVGFGTGYYPTRIILRVPTGSLGGSSGIVGGENVALWGMTAARLHIRYDSLIAVCLKQSLSQRIGPWDI